MIKIQRHNGNKIQIQINGIIKIQGLIEISVNFHLSNKL